MKAFEYEAHASRVIFGAGYLDCVADEVRAFDGGGCSGARAVIRFRH